MAETPLDFDILAQDNIRTLSLPAGSFKKPLCIILVGIPESGKSFVTKKLAEKFPLVVLSETDMMAFLAPRATIFRRGTIEVFQLATKTMELLIKMGKACIYDANIKTREQRDLIKTVVEQAGGSYLLIHTDCPKEICYKRVKKHNLAVTRGEEKGFIMDKDYFEYESASSGLPSLDEHHLTYSCQEPESISLIEAAVDRRLKESQ